MLVQRELKVSASARVSIKGLCDELFLTERRKDARVTGVRVKVVFLGEKNRYASPTVTVTKPKAKRVPPVANAASLNPLEDAAKALYEAEYPRDARLYGWYDLSPSMQADYLYRVELANARDCA